MRYFGIFLISLATLTLEVLHMRLFSVTLWHHLAYMVITVAMLGFGASGAFLSAWRALAPKEAVDRRLAWYGLAFSATLFISFLVTLRVPLDTFQLMTPPPEAAGVALPTSFSRPLQLMYVFLYYASLLPPYFFAGLMISLSFTREPGKAGVIYFFNLAGSALGCFAVVALIKPLTGEGMILLTLALGVLSALAFVLAERPRSKPQMAVAIMALLALTALIPVRDAVFPVQVAGTKALGVFEALDPHLKQESRQWDPVARIDVVSSEKSAKLFHMLPELPHKIITIDGDAYTYLYQFPVPWKDYGPLGKSLYAAAYKAHPRPQKVLAVGLGGGIDIATALYHQPKNITGVEINQAMIDATGAIFGDFSKHIYQQPGVKIVHSEGRSYIKRSTEKYDIIQLSGVDTWSALASGAYVLSENYLYTVEAVKEYVQHLTDTGVVCIIRWLFEPPRETLRLMAVGAQALRELGVQDPGQHMALVTMPFFGAMIISRSPLTQHQISSLQALGQNPLGGMEVKMAWPRGEPDSPFTRLMQAAGRGDGALETFYDNYRFNVTPVYDDQPFFFSYYRWGDLFNSTIGVGGSMESQSPVGLWILLLSLLQATLLAVLLIVVPLLKLKSRPDAAPVAGKGWVMGYFGSLGVGFMLIEVGLMQKLALYLSNPTYSIAVTMASLLLFSGLGSLLSGRSRLAVPTLLKLTLPMLAALGAVELYVAVPAVVEATLGASMTVRVLLTVLLLAPLGLLMGMPFPNGIRLLGESAPHLVPWAWGVNGALSVTASVGAILLAMSTGFNVVLGVGLCCYLLALLCLRSFTRQSSHEQP